MSTTMTSTLGVSNLRGSSRQTRTNPTRTSKAAGPTLRQNSLISNPSAPLLGATEPHGFYPAIQHFADAIAALPRDYRRHTSLLKEVDAKAWQPEENLQTLLTQCGTGTPGVALPANLHSAVGSSANAADEAVVLSAANSVVGAPMDAASQYSTESAASVAVQRRQLFAALRHNLMQIMVTMDEKNHVINNANEELSRHVRRLDNIWPHLADEISEEARLGSLKHWAYTETNPTKKSNAPGTRREAATNLALLHENEVAQRSESRREAVAAKSKQRLDRLAQIDAGFEEIRTATKRTVADGKRRAADSPDVTGLGISGTSSATGKRKKPDKAVSLASLAFVNSISAALTSSRPMSREPSQQDHTKKRKAPAATSTVARKRLNANQDSPKPASSPLAGNFGKDAYKRSPALGSARPASSRARQNSAQVARPASSASQRNVNGLPTTSVPEITTTVTIGKGVNETRNMSKEMSKSEEDIIRGANGEAATRGGGLLLERRASKQGSTRSDLIDGTSKAAASPKLSIATTTNARGRTSKTSTPVVGSFADAELVGSGPNGNGNGKSKRPARPRAKDHGLHDSLSPKGLPLKRSHKKGAGLWAQQQNQQQQQQQNNTSARQREKEAEIENTTPEEDDEELGGDGEGEGEGEDEEHYCFCDGPSYGEMVACDNEECPRQWFHIECLGLKTVPKSASWYCSECKDAFGGSNGKGGKGRVNGNGNGSGSGNGGGGR